MNDNSLFAICIVSFMAFLMLAIYMAPKIQPAKQDRDHVMIVWSSEMEPKKAHVPFDRDTTIVDTITIHGHQIYKHTHYKRINLE